MLVALEVDTLVRKCGCEVAGPVGTIDDALHVAGDADVDGAVSGVNIGGERIWPVADLLHEHSIPFVFAIGYSQAEIPERFRRATVVTKPWRAVHSTRR